MADRPERPVLVINVVGLSPHHLGPNTPRITALRNAGQLCTLEEPFPAVTCTSQSDMLTGKRATDHGIVANGWYFRQLSEVWLWRQSNRLVEAEKVWDVARRQYPGLRVLKHFWWYNMYADVDLSVTPRPMYPADGRKLPDIYSDPPELRHSLQKDLGPFPLFNFWGPTADIRSSRWIAESGVRLMQQERPDLTLVYLPHLDYNLQRLGPGDPAIAQDLLEIDLEVGKLIDEGKRQNARIMIVSEYGIEEATGVVHINKALREAGMIRIRDELGLELLDAGACRAFAVADHQIAHVYIKDPADVPKVRALLEKLDGIDKIFGDDDGGKARVGLDHPRSGDLVCMAAPGRWFTYYYWLDDAVAPDFARCVDIHRKPGYDPAELFVDPQLPAPKLRVAFRLAQKLSGFRYLMDVIGLDPSVVKGTHGRPAQTPDTGPLLISDQPGGELPERMPMTGVQGEILRALGMAGQG